MEKDGGGGRTTHFLNYNLPASVGVIYFIFSIYLLFSIIEVVFCCLFSLCKNGLSLCNHLNQHLIFYFKIQEFFHFTIYEDFSFSHELMNLALQREEVNYFKKNLIPHCLVRYTVYNCFLKKTNHPQTNSTIFIFSLSIQSEFYIFL